MKLKLEVFTEIAILDISESLTVEDMQVLEKGFEKLVELHCKCLILNLTHTVISQEALDHFIKMRSALESKLKGLILVGPASSLCHYPELSNALNEILKLGYKESKAIIHLKELQSQYEELLREMQWFTSEEANAITDQAGLLQLAELRRETTRLKKLQSFYINEMVRQANYNLPSNSDDPELEEIQNALNQKLIDLKLTLKPVVATEKSAS